jgi:orotidine-5'-phosphate decarboxylase
MSGRRTGPRGPAGGGLSTPPMTFLEMLQDAQQRNASMLCVGLDPEPAPSRRLKDDAGRIFDFCARIVDATGDLVIAFKPQIAYFAAHRAEAQLEQLVRTSARNCAARAGDPGRQARRHRLHRGAVRASRPSSATAPTP